MAEPATVTPNRQVVVQNRPAPAATQPQTPTNGGQATATQTRPQTDGMGNPITPPPAGATGFATRTGAVQNNTNPAYDKNQIVSIGKGNYGEEAIFAKQDPGEILRGLIALNKQGKAADAINQIKQVSVLTSRGGLPLPIYTVSPTGVATKSGAVSQAGALANSSLLNVIASISGANKSVGEFGYGGLISAIELLSLEVNDAKIKIDSPEFTQRATLLFGESQDDIDGLKSLIRDNPNLVQGATASLESLKNLKKIYERTSADGKKEYDQMVKTAQELKTTTAAAGGQ